MDDRLASDLASLRIDRRPQSGSASSRRALRWVIALALACALLAAAWRLALPVMEARLFKTEVGLTEIATVSPAQSQVELTSTGYVVPQVQVDVSSKLVGRVERTNVTEGAHVKVGQMLFELDASDQRVLVASAVARVASARARAAAARAQLAEVVL
ncbi:MAG: biotin/lipoyl-binding protein, partial [Myxococcota bacterium]|nr:biotin/lipoyl-binding protein [Myxococcota bacterium]